jgi:hypothetical protein
MPHHIASYHIRLLSGGRIFSSTPVLLSAGLVIIVSKDNSSRYCTVRLPGHWHWHWHPRSKREEDSGQWQAVAFVNFRVGMATRSTVLHCRAHWHHSSEIPVKSSESHNRTVLDITVRASCRRGVSKRKRKREPVMAVSIHLA